MHQLELALSLNASIRNSFVSTSQILHHPNPICHFRHREANINELKGRESKGKVHLWSRHYLFGASFVSWAFPFASFYGRVSAFVIAVLLTLGCFGFLLVWLLAWLLACLWALGCLDCLLVSIFSSLYFACCFYNISLSFFPSLSSSVVF